MGCGPMCECVCLRRAHVLMGLQVYTCDGLVGAFILSYIDIHESFNGLSSVEICFI